MNQQDNATRKYVLGFYSLRFDSSVINRMLQYLDIDCSTKTTRDLRSPEQIDDVDTIMALNPSMEGEQLEGFIDHLFSGGTAVILVSCELQSYQGTAALLDRLGVSLTQTSSINQFRIKYTSDYFIPYKQNKRVLFKAPDRKPFSTFSSKTADEVERICLIKKSGFLSSPCIAMQVKLGRGRVVLMDSSSLIEDRADIVGHMLKTATKSKMSSTDSENEQILLRLANVMMNAFEVYEEIPISLVRAKAELPASVSTLQLYDMIEQLIRERIVLAKIRNDVVVRL